MTTVQALEINAKVLDFSTNHTEILSHLNEKQERK